MTMAIAISTQTYLGISFPFKKSRPDESSVVDGRQLLVDGRDGRRVVAEMHLILVASIDEGV